MFYVPEKYQENVRLALDLQEYKFKFCNTGVETLYAHF